MEVGRIGMPRKKRRNNPGQGNGQDQEEQREESWKRFFKI